MQQPESGVRSKKKRKQKALKTRSVTTLPWENRGKRLKTREHEDKPLPKLRKDRRGRDALDHRVGGSFEGGKRR